MRFTETDYPSLHIESNSTSILSQKKYKGITIVVLSAMLISTVMGSIADNITELCPIYDKINGVILLFAAIITTILTYTKPEKKWYVGRAIAESVKTLSWRYMMHSEPFNTPNEASNNELISRLKAITAIAKSDGYIPDLDPTNEIITQKMILIRESSFNERKGIYAEQRIGDQINWYHKKSVKNKNAARVFTILIITFQILAGVYLIFLVESWKNIHINEILIFIATSGISLLEMNKYKELHEAYAFTKTELLYIRSRVSTIQDSAELDEFVNEAEQAISREHTMWLARRGDSNYLNK